MKNPSVLCSVCKEPQFRAANTKKPVTCWQCRYEKNARRKFRGTGKAADKWNYAPRALNKRRAMI